MVRLSKPGTIISPVLSLVANLCMVFVAYMLCRVLYVAMNHDLIASTMTGDDWALMFRGGTLFDISAILYTNLPYILMMLIPERCVFNALYQKIARGYFVAVNGLCIAMNMADGVYFAFTGRRTTATVFSEFSNEGNIAGIIMTEVVSHWYLILILAAMVWVLWRCFLVPVQSSRRVNPWLNYGLRTLLLVPCAWLCVVGMRGGATHAVRPITISNANQYASTPARAAAVLNTPFAIIRTINKTSFQDPGYFTPEQLDAIYTPVHQPADGDSLRRKNVVILIVESMGSEYVGALNGIDSPSMTPFLDSLVSRSVTWQHTFANGRKSIDGMPSILSGIPMFVEPFVLTPSSMNKVSGLAGELGKEGYSTAFFHGAENSSMGFQAFARATGFQAYYGRDDYEGDPRFGGHADFDGTWAIWDEPFLQYFALKTGEMPQPFVAAVFTASNHHPFVVPEDKASMYPEGELQIHKCVRYTDDALRHYFETASRQPWFDNTLFVLTADHTNMSAHGQFQTPLGAFRVPILFFDPSGELTPGVREGIAQQIDIMPTVLSLLRYGRPYIAFGRNALDDNSRPWAVQYNNGVYQMVTQPSTVTTFDGTEVVRVDDFMSHPLMDSPQGKEAADTADVTLLKAIIQSYMHRMINDSLVVNP